VGRRRREVEPHGRRQIDSLQVRIVEGMWLAFPLSTASEVAAFARVSRDTAWRHRRRLEAAGRLPVMSRKERGRARTNARFAEMLSDPDNVFHTRKRRRPRTGWWNRTDIQIEGPLTGQIWTSPAFPDLLPPDSVPSEEELATRMQERMGHVIDDYLRRVRPRLRREALERVKGERHSELAPLMRVRVRVSTVTNEP
jgi:hypothetical protein